MGKLGEFISDKLVEIAEERCLGFPAKAATPHDPDADRRMEGKDGHKFPIHWQPINSKREIKILLIVLLTYKTPRS